MTDSRTSYGRSTSRRDEDSKQRRMAGADEAAAKEEKKRKMRERLELWRKRKEQEKQQQHPAQSTSRASSVAVEDSPESAPFVTAANSVVSDSSEAGFESLPMTSRTNTPPPLQLPSKPAVQPRPAQMELASPGVVQQKVLGKTLGLKRPAGVGLSGPQRKFGKMGLKPSRLLASPGIKGGVFSADDDDTASAAGNQQKQQKQPIRKPVIPLDSDSAKENTHLGTAEEAPEIDPLEAYMQGVVTQVNGSQAGDASGDASSEQLLGVDDDINYDDGLPDDPEDVIAMAAKRLKKKDLAAVDHSKMNYEPFTKDFYIEPLALRNLTAEEVDMMRANLGGVKIRGVDCPKPAQDWSHFGLPAACADVIRHQGFESPTPIQAQAVPAILSGRDVIGVAKTGSGKTLAFILPMLRHIKAQRALEQGDGPIGLVMTPTRELAVQIHRECKPFLKALGLQAVCAYGGSAIKDQIGELKRGAEIVVCTPGRLIDLLCANSGRVTNLQRVTYLVLDEADRMFDMGFEPQVTKIVQAVRPTRQTVLFSATFPRQMEALARKILRRPLEIVVGGRSLIPPEVTQHVEVVESSDKFVRLLAILGDAFNSNKDTLALVFVDRQEAADGLLRDLMRRGYVCNSLHGGKDQTDRDQAIADFKNRVFSVLIATSVAARGLDVRGLNVVINYDCPNHMEDLVHRVGRTGRAGNKGDAYTFITPDQDRYASEVVKAMKLSHLTPPDSVQQLADQFLEKVRAGKERHSSKSGFGGKGLEKLDKERDMVKKIQKVSYGNASGEALDDDDDEEEEGVAQDVDSDGEPIVSTKPSVAAAAAGGEIVRRTTTVAAAPAPVPVKASTPTQPSPAQEGISAAASAALLAAQAAAQRLNVNTSGTATAAVSVVDQINQQLGTTSDTQAKKDAADIASALASLAPAPVEKPSIIPVGEFACELDINDYHQKARWRATNRETLSQIIEQTGAAITTRGVFVPPGKAVPEGERKLYLSIESDSERSVEQARNELKRILTEATLHIMEQEARGGSGRYSVV